MGVSLARFLDELAWSLTMAGTKYRALLAPPECPHMPGGEDPEFPLALCRVGALPAEVGDAAKSLQSCPTLGDPIDSSPPGFPVPGILQARTLEWVAISFSNA